jgi:protein CpxP
MTKRVLIAAGLVAALAGVTIAWAQDPQPGPGIEQRGPRGRHGRLGPGGPGGPGPDLLGLRGIELTDAQREQVRSIMESHQAEFQQVHQKVREAHRTLAEATNADTIDEAAIRTRSAAVATAMADEAILRGKVRAEVFAILTAEQQQQLRERRAERQKRLEERRK